MQHPVQVQQQHAFYVPSNTEQWKAHCTIKRRNGVWWLTDVWCEPDCRGQGYATAVVKAALHHYRHEVLYAQIQPYGDHAMDEDQLRAWYKQFGFVSAPWPGGLVRMPPTALRTTNDAKESQQ
jgi:GNAT superfamily N-acetyltransferase